LAANLILTDATVTRPDAFIGQLLYKHIEFQLFPPLSKEEEQRLYIILKINLEHIKKSEGQSEPKEFAFREDDILLYNLFIPIIAFVFIDNTFINEFNDPEDIYNFIVPANSDYLRLQWKQEWSDRLIFYDIEPFSNDAQIALKKALPYSKEKGHLIRLGRSVGLTKAFE